MMNNAEQPIPRAEALSAPYVKADPAWHVSRLIKRADSQLRRIAELEARVARLGFWARAAMALAGLIGAMLIYSVCALLKIYNGG